MKRRYSILCAFTIFHTLLIVLNTLLLVQHLTFNDVPTVCCDFSRGSTANIPMMRPPLPELPTLESPPSSLKSLPETPSRMAEPGNVIAASQWKNDNNVVHVVLTRFMQHQPNLIHLGMARLELFRTFCLPSMMGQTTKQFLWIIRADPELNTIVKDEFISLLRSLKVKASNLNIVLVGSRSRIDNGHFRAEEAISDINQNSIWWGDYSLVRDYFRRAQEKIVLETGLDADDGLALHFLEDMQVATARLAVRIEKRTSSWWRIWCIESVDEWQFFGYDNRDNNVDSYESESSYGAIRAEKDVQTFCRTPGLTRVSTVDHKRYKDLSMYMKGDNVTELETSLDGTGFFVNHFPLRRLVRTCRDKFFKNIKAKDVFTRCLAFLRSNYTQAIRARSPTSTGMKDIDPPSSNPGTATNSPDEDIVGAYDATAAAAAAAVSLGNTKDTWERATSLFGLVKEDIKQSRQRILADLPQILSDALTGQCTPGHSCKRYAATSLKQMLRTAAATAAAVS